MIKNPKRTSLIIVALMIIFILATYNSHIRPRFSFGLTYAQIEEEILTPDFKLYSVTDTLIDITDYRGETLFLTFWHTDDPNSKDHLIELSKANKVLADENLGNIVAINMMEDSDTVFDYAWQNEILLPMLLDSDGSVTDAFGIKSIPVTVILNPDGTVYDGIKGQTNESTIVAIAKRMQP